MSPDPNQVLAADVEIVLIGTVQAEDRFLERFGVGRGDA